MKKLFFALALLVSISASSQIYQYYFLEIRATGKAEIQIAPEMGVEYSDIDTLIVSARETKKNGAVIITGKKYASYSAAFNALSAVGMEFVQFANLSTFGGGTALLGSDMRINYIIWRRKM